MAEKEENFRGRGRTVMYRIFIIEDDFSLAQAMKKQIEAWGHEVRCVEDFQNVIPAFVEYDPHMVLVDIMLPFFNGYHWCSEIRKISEVPVIFISSASDNMNIVMAMNMGGDDFIAKPVDLNVMTAKMQALLRRTYYDKALADGLLCGGEYADGQCHPAAQEAGGHRFDRFHCDPDRQRVYRGMSAPVAASCRIGPAGRGELP